jgi:GTP 3',8-cyclase
MNQQIIDSCSRPINYLRISVTDRCNLRCVYCQPAEGIQLMQHDDILTYEEIVRITKAAAELGITKVRLTGGEPLVRLNVTALINDISKIKGIDDISLTTNGVLLKGYAEDLKKAGLKRVNVSLDTLKPSKFKKITRMGKFKQVIDGIEAAREAGLVPVKINVVAMRGVNDDEILDFARLSMKEGWNIRFIELMPFNGGNPPEEHNIGQGGQPQQFVSVGEIKEKIEKLGHLEPVSGITGAGPAKYFRLDGAKGTLGFISPISDHFCFSCNRLRLTADGKLRPCLLSDREIDLKALLRGGATIDQIKGKIVEAIKSKPRGHDLAKGKKPENRSMSQVGG